MKNLASGDRCFPTLNELGFAVKFDARVRTISTKEGALLKRAGRSKTVLKDFAELVGSVVRQRTFV